MHLITPLVVGFAAAAIAATIPHAPPQGLHKPPTRLAIAHEDKCYSETLSSCLLNVEQPASELVRTGCKIAAEMDCRKNPSLPKFLPPATFVTKALMWIPPDGCRAEWDRCIDQLELPVFNRLVCRKYIPVICNGKVNRGEQRKQIDNGLDSLNLHFNQTMAYLYDRVPPDKAQWFDRCLSNDFDHDMENSTKPDAETFFACLEQVKHADIILPGHIKGPKFPPHTDTFNQTRTD